MKLKVSLSLFFLLLSGRSFAQKTTKYDLNPAAPFAKVQVAAGPAVYNHSPDPSNDAIVSGYCAKVEVDFSEFRFSPKDHLNLNLNFALGRNGNAEGYTTVWGDLYQDIFYHISAQIDLLDLIYGEYDRAPQIQTGIVHTNLPNNTFVIPLDICLQGDGLEMHFVFNFNPFTRKVNNSFPTPKIDLSSFNIGVTYTFMGRED